MSRLLRMLIYIEPDFGLLRQWGFQASACGQLLSPTCWCCSQSEGCLLHGEAGFSTSTYSHAGFCTFLESQERSPCLSAFTLTGGNPPFHLRIQGPVCGHFQPVLRAVLLIFPARLVNIVQAVVALRNLERTPTRRTGSQCRLNLRRCPPAPHMDP